MAQYEEILALLTRGGHPAVSARAGLVQAEPAGRQRWYRLLRRSRGRSKRSWRGPRELPQPAAAEAGSAVLQ